MAASPTAAIFDKFTDCCVAREVEALLPADIILKQKRVTSVHPGFQVSSADLGLPEFATVEVCPVVGCTAYNKPVYNMAYGDSLSGAKEFDWDLAKSSRCGCSCGALRHVQRVLFTNCFANVEYCEKFVNGRHTQGHLKQNSSGQTTILDMPGHYTVINVSTRNRPFSWS